MNYDKVESVTICIPMVPPSLNVQLRLNPFKRHAWGQACQRTIYALLSHRDRGWLESLAANGEKMRITLCLEHMRFYDKDNLYGAAKPVVDSLVRLKILRDDRDKYCDLNVTQEKSHENCTRIKIEKAAV